MFIEENVFSMKPAGIFFFLSDVFPFQKSKVYLYKKGMRKYSTKWFQERQDRL